MTQTLKSNEALSNGYIFNKDAKLKEQMKLDKAKEAFFKKGGKVSIIK